MKAKHAKTFNDIATLYDDARVGYPSQIFDVIDLYAELNENSRILEVGCGTGIATREIIIKWNPSIVAIDPGSNLIEVASKKSLENGKAQYINCPFEEFESDERFDAIFSATAFHWLDKRSKYKKSYKMLNEKGKLILFWNNYLVADEDVNTNIQDLYKKYHPDRSIKDSRLHYKNKIRERKNEINNSKLFDLIVHHENSFSITMDSRRYINLLKSFSNNSYIGSNRLNRFYEEIERYIESIGNEVKISIVVNLEIANKR